MDPLALSPVDVVALTRALVDIESTTGQEGEAGRYLSSYLRGRGFAVLEQPVDKTRFNIIASYVDTPEIVLSTHFDCVPPFFPSRLEGSRIYGRGACDAKGILAAQVAAADRLRREGERRVGLLFVVGEERSADGARRANGVADGSRYLINGEPTDNRLGTATRGVLRVTVKAAGRAAHSAYPELGESAIDRLIDALLHLRTLALPEDPVLGQTHYTVGTIRGGVASNVVSPSAEAEVMFRTVSAPADMRAAIKSLEDYVTVEYLHEVAPVHLVTVPGFEQAVFPYTTDVPFLHAWGQPLLYGPGSIHVAHTDTEFIDVPELEAAIDGYVRLARSLLTSR